MLVWCNHDPLLREAKSPLLSGCECSRALCVRFSCVCSLLVDSPATLRRPRVLDPPAGSLVGKPFGHPLRHPCGFNPPAGSPVVDKSFGHSCLWTINRPVADEEPCCCAGGCGKLELSTHLFYICVHVHELTKLVRKKYVYFCILIRGLLTHWHNTHYTLNVTVWLICCDRRCWRLVLVGGSWWSCGVRACAPCELSSLPLSHTWVLWLWVHIIKFPQIPLQELQLVFV